jgi:hypothetical protein
MGPGDPRRPDQGGKLRQEAPAAIRRHPHDGRLTSREGKIISPFQRVAAGIEAGPRPAKPLAKPGGHDASTSL